ncbi:MAG: hypothetical protein C4527_06470 [Candidatus Omnitrophota bacterium]|jgi:hypothetical protein|nr:MAG: hypothetical protein C4527_06470 [Candidatus Omnitrophota bacterium]
MHNRYLLFLCIVLFTVPGWSHEVIEGWIPVISYSSSIYGARVVIDPPMPGPDEEFTVTLVGAFPSSGYRIVGKTFDTIVTPESIDFLIDIKIEEPEGPQDLVITPFSELLGSAALGEGRYMFSGFINGQLFLHGYILIGVVIPDPIVIPFNARLVAEPGNPQPNQEFSIYVTGQFPTPGYEIESADLRILESYPEKMVADIKVRELEGVWAQVITPFRALVGTAQLGEGMHPLTGIVNGIPFYESVIQVGEVVVMPPPTYNARIIFTPEHPEEGEEVSIYVVGEFPTPGYEFVGKTVNILESYPEQLSIELKIAEPEEPQAQVITPFRELIDTVALGNGAHPYYASVNGIFFDRGIIMVGEPTPVEPPIMPYHAKLIIEPPHPEPGEEFSIFIEGEYPTPGYEITSKEITPLGASPEPLMISVTVRELEGEWIQVITQFRALAGTMSLGEGWYTLCGFINGEAFAKEMLIVGNPQREDPQPVPVYNTRVVIEPENPQAGETFSVYIEGEFPSPGYFITSKELLTSDSIPEHLLVNLEVEEPTGPQLTVMTPFREFIGTAVMAEGAHPVYATINGERLYQSVLFIGDANANCYLHFIRSGGFAGFYEQITVYDTGEVIVNGRRFGSGQSEVNQLSAEALYLLKQTVDANDFHALQPVYSPETPYADGFVYELTYRNAPTVVVNQGAVVPDDLGKAVRLLEQILIGNYAVVDLETVTAVEKWLLY